jgi:hypothetical protein
MKNCLSFRIWRTFARPSDWNSDSRYIELDTAPLPLLTGVNQPNKLTDLSIVKAVSPPLRGLMWRPVVLLCVQFAEFLWSVLRPHSSISTVGEMKPEHSLMSWWIAVRWNESDLWLLLSLTRGIWYSLLLKFYEIICYLWATKVSAVQVFWLSCNKCCGLRCLRDFHVCIRTKFASLYVIPTVNILGSLRLMSWQVRSTYFLFHRSTKQP